MVSTRRFAASALCVAIATGVSPLMMSQALSAPTENPSPPPATPAYSPAIERLSSMFSEEIQTTVRACAERGMVDLAAGATPEGNVICADGQPQDGVPYTDYLSTVSDILAASSLVGFKTALSSDPRLSPELFAAFIASPQGLGTLRTIVQTAISQSQLIPAEETDSNAILTDEVVEKMVPRLSEPQALNALFGSEEQYGTVVQSFCTPPGNSVGEVITQVPGLDSLQLYAICLQEAGVVDDIERMLN